VFLLVEKLTLYYLYPTKILIKQHDVATETYLILLKLKIIILNIVRFCSVIAEFFFVVIEVVINKNLYIIYIFIG